MTSIVRTAGPTFLRRPRGIEWVADVLRVLTLLSIPIATIVWGPIAFAVMSLTLFGVVVPRMLGLRPGFDFALCLLALVAGWSSALEWYTTVPGWDKLVHFLLVGALAVLVVAVAVCGSIGLAIGAVWEMFEWVGHNFLDSTIFVGYDDTIGDLLADGAGGMVVGIVARWCASDRRIVEPPVRSWRQSPAV